MPLNKETETDTKQSDSEVPVMELGGIIHSVRAPSMGQIELFNHLLYWKPFDCGK